MKFAMKLDKDALNPFGMKKMHIQPIGIKHTMVARPAVMHDFEKEQKSALEK